MNEVITEVRTSNIWIAERLGIGHDRSVSMLIKQGKNHEIIQERCKELEKILPCWLIPESS